MLFSRRQMIESKVNKYYTENPGAQVCTLNTISVLDGLGLLMPPSEEHVVLGHAQKPFLDEAIAVPEYLRAPDGRRFQVVRWTPSIEQTKAVTIEMVVDVSLPERSKSNED